MEIVKRIGRFFSLWIFYTLSFAATSVIVFFIISIIIACVKLAISDDYLSIAIIFGFIGFVMSFPFAFNHSKRGTKKVEKIEEKKDNFIRLVKS